MHFDRTLYRRFFWILAVLWMPMMPVWAHSPLFPQSNKSIQTAYTIRDPLKSWAVYAELSKPGEAAYYQMEMQAGDRIAVILFSAQDPGRTKFLPSITVTGSENVLVHQDGRAPAKAAYEPFTATWFYRLATIDIAAPESGIYHLRISNGAQGIGRYGLAVGYKEEWTPAELILLPWKILKIYLWEGQNIFLVLLPVALVCVLGGLAIVRRTAQGKSPSELSQWFAAFSGLLFLGSLVLIACQALLAFRHTGISGHAIITGLVAAVPVLLSTLVLMFALRRRERVAFAWRLALIAVGILGLASWSGLCLGPLLAFVAAFSPATERTSGNRIREDL